MPTLPTSAFALADAVPFVISDQPEIYARQKRGWVAVGLPTDAQAVIILVQLIKHPDIDIEQLAVLLSEQGSSIEPATIRSFLQLHDLSNPFLHKFPVPGINNMLQHFRAFDIARPNNCRK